MAAGLLRMTAVYRYAQSAPSDIEVIDAHPNYHFLTVAGGVVDGGTVNTTV